MTQNTTSSRRPRLAAVITAYKRLLHGQHVVDRFLDGYGWAGTYHHPEMDVVSLYVADLLAFFQQAITVAA